MAKTVTKVAGATTIDDLVTDHVASVAHNVIDRAAQQCGNAEARARDAAALSVQKLEGAQEQAKQRLDITVGRIAQIILERPVAAIGFVFVTGTVVGTMLRR